MNAAPRTDWATYADRVREAEHLTSLIEEMMATGDLIAGDRLPSERALAAFVGLSRGSVREAIHELELKGVVERTPGRGTTLRDSPGKSVHSLLGILDVRQRQLAEMQDVRLVVEPGVAARAAQRITRAELLQLERLLDLDVAALTPERSAQLDREFHASIARAAHNALLVDLVETTAEWTGSVRTASHRHVTSREESHAGHRQILEALRSGDGAEAYRAMRDHLTSVSDLINARGPADQAVQPADQAVQEEPPAESQAGTPTIREATS